MYIAHFAETTQSTHTKTMKKHMIFFVLNAGENFNLKAKKGSLGKSILDGAYHTMIDAIAREDTPNFLLMTYSGVFQSVVDLILLPKESILAQNIIPRKPLSANARRAGWVGCNIDISNVSENGKISIVSGGNLINGPDVLLSTKLSLDIYKGAHKNRLWINDILVILEKLGSRFTLTDIYAFENFLQDVIQGITISERKFDNSFK